MNTQFVQALRYKLQNRYRRLNSINDDFFIMQLGLFLSFLESDPLLGGVLTELTKRNPSGLEIANKLLQIQGLNGFQNEGEQACASYHFLKGLANLGKESKDTIVQTGFALSRTGKLAEAYELIRRLFLENLYEFIDEHLDDQRMVLELLRRYKHRCEWFHRERLLVEWEKATQHGEKNLGLDLYAYLYEQGIDFHIEPWGESGAIDLIGMQRTDDPLLCDVKIFHPEKSKGAAYVRSAIHQIHTYMNSYNEGVGYLVIFNLQAKPLIINAASSHGIPHVQVGHKTIYLVVIDLHLHEKSASKRGQLQAITLSESDLVPVQQVGFGGAVENSPGEEPSVEV